MKLSYKKTLLVGFVFFLICMFWQAYDSLVPKILTDKFGLPQTASGFIMALDNIFALFLLPLFGGLSDKCKSRFGRRTPFIVVGTVLASVFAVVLSLFDGMQKAALDAAGVTYNLENRVALAWQVTADNPLFLILFILMLLFVLLSMAVFRSPAVALMPDVTLKPLRSKANAIINLMGAAGGILVLGLGIVFGTGKPENALMSYTQFFLVISALMLVCLVIFLFTVKEPKLVREMQEENEKYKDEIVAAEVVSEGKSVETSSKERRTALFLILASVALWFMGYNAVTSKYSLYAGTVLGLDFNMTLIIAQAAAIVSYIPIGIVSSRLGRKKTILGGIVLLFTAFFAASFLRAGTPDFVMWIFFILAGVGWAAINVNSFPMVVELASGDNVGKYTGYYYTASMAAQTLTPLLSGLLMDVVTGISGSDVTGMTTLFPYAALFVAASFVTMFLTRHGDSKPLQRSALETLGGDD